MLLNYLFTRFGHVVYQWHNYGEIVYLHCLIKINFFSIRPPFERGEMFSLTCIVLNILGFAIISGFYAKKYWSENYFAKFAIQRMFYHTLIFFRSTLMLRFFKKIILSRFCWRPPGNTLILLNVYTIFGKKYNFLYLVCRRTKIF